MNDLPKRKPNRLKNYDYSQNGAYFVTICTKDHHEILGSVISVGDAALGVPSVELSEYGEIVEGFIENIAYANPDLHVPFYVIMPNHIHLILVVESRNIEGNGTPRAASPTKMLDAAESTKTLNSAASPTKMLVPKIINALKGLSTKKAGFPLWQRSYHDHIICSEQDYLRIAEYIENNPANWDKDCYYIS